MKRILVTGASGQIGSDLSEALNRRSDTEELILTDLDPPKDMPHDAVFEKFDVRDRSALDNLLERHAPIDTVFHLASLLSAKGEKRPGMTWDVNMSGLQHILHGARDHGYTIFWPSSIAVFGPATPRAHTPQYTTLDPYTMYGVTKVSGELLCRYYYRKHGVDVRSIRYPGIISHKTAPGGGTTDYAVEIFSAAVEEGQYTCFLKPKTRLPMMYMPDAIKAALKLMDADAERITVRTSYNVAALSFSPEELVKEIAAHVPDFSCTYEPDERQDIADSWPASIDDGPARRDWRWEPQYDLPALVEDMVRAVREKQSVQV